MLDDASSHASLDAAPPEYVAPLYAYLVSDLADNITGETIGDEAAVVTVASTAGLRGHGVGPSYTSSKKGVIALTRLAAFQYGAKGIRINCVCPGATAGEGMGAAFTDAAMAARASADITLLSDETSYLTGQVIAVDGGAVIR